jgi:cytochrome c
MLVLSSALLLGVVCSLQIAHAHDSTSIRLLVCSASTAEYDVPNSAALEFIQRLSLQHHWSVTTTADPLAFQYDSLKTYAAIIFLNNVGTTVDSSLRSDVERFVREGGGAVFIHASIDANPSWDFYQSLVGVQSRSATAVQDARVHILDDYHPSTSHGGKTWTVRERILNLTSNLRQYAHVLAAFDSRTIDGGTMGLDHPMTWCSQIDQGRSWVTTIGSEEGTYNDARLQRHIEQGIRWASHLVDGDASAFRFQSYSMRTVAQIGGIVSLTSLPNRKLFVATRHGEFFVVSRDGQVQRKAGEIWVGHGGEDGTLGVVAESRRSDSIFVYVFAADRNSSAVTLRRVLVDSDTIVASATRTILSFPYDPDAFYHVGGGLALDNRTGDLFIGTGDNTNAEGLGGYPGLDERPGQSFFDAQRTSSNTMSLRGKVLRIRPRLDGSGYDIPDGNLYPIGTDSTLPEIYAMGLRNPFRLAVDSVSGTICVGDVGPNPWPIKEVFGDVDGVEELNVMSSPGNYGWPYFLGNNDAFNLVDMGPPPVSRGQNNPVLPVNASPNNTGKRVLPPALPFTYGYRDFEPDSALCGKPDGRAICAGPYIELHANLTPGSLPRQLHNYWLLYDFARGWIRCFRLDSVGQVIAGFPLYLRPDSSSILDLELTDDGELYALVWDDPKRGAAKARVVKIEWNPTTSAPLLPRIRTDVSYGAVPLNVVFDGRESRGKIASYEWDFDGDGVTDSFSSVESWSYTSVGTYVARLTVRDSSDTQSSTSTTIIVGNSPPTIESLSPSHGMVYREGNPVEVTVVASDDHTAETDLSYSIAMLLGHDNHAHPVDEQSGSTVVLQSPVLRNHGSAQQLFALVTVSVKDQGNGAAAALQRDTSIILQPHLKEAEYSTPGLGCTKTTSPINDNMAGIRMRGNGAFWYVSPLRLDNIVLIRCYGVSASPFTLRFRLNSVDGPDVAEPMLWFSSHQNGVPFVISSRLTFSSDTMHTLFVVLESTGTNELFVDALEFVDATNSVDNLAFETPSLSIENGVLTNNLLRFTVHHSRAVAATANVVNLLGSVVVSRPCFTNLPSEISLNSLPSGAYMLNVSTQDGSATVPFNIAR